MEEAEELEVSFRLDGEGRTIPSSSSPDLLPPSDGAGGGGEGATATTVTTDVLEYGSRTDLTSLRYAADDEDPASSFSSSSKIAVDDVASAMDELLLDAEISDCGLMPRTFWVPAPPPEDETGTGSAKATTFSPRCSLELLALDVFRHHTDRARGSFDPSTSGAEWWVQIRPSPERTGRYSMLDDKEGGPRVGPAGDDDDCVKKGGISFHWDKDEDLRLLAGGTMNVHPHLSTVTYLTGIGAPTLAVNYRVHSLTGEPLPNPHPEAFASWPWPLKHLAFDGRFLHAALPDLMEEGAWARQTTVPPRELSTASSDAERKRVQRRYRRVTFLVNIWLNYRPFNVNPFPDTMIDKMSGCRGQRRVGLSFSTASPKPDNPGAIQHPRESSAEHSNSLHGGAPAVPSPLKALSPSDALLVVIDDTDDQDSADYSVFTFPMGTYQSGECIRMCLPLQRIRSVAKVGGNASVRWKDNEYRKRIMLLTSREQEVGKVGAAPRSSSPAISLCGRGDEADDEPSRKRARASA